MGVPQHEGRDKYPAGTLVAVWTGAFVGSPGVPPADADGVACRIDHWNTVGQAYVYRLDGGRTPGGNPGMYVFAPAILRKIDHSFTPAELAELAEPVADQAAAVRQLASTVDAAAAELAAEPRCGLHGVAGCEECDPQPPLPPAVGRLPFPPGPERYRRS